MITIAAVILLLIGCYVLFFGPVINNFYHKISKLCSCSKNNITSNGLDPLNYLPNDMMHVIYDSLDLASRCRFSAVCRAWRKTAATTLAAPAAREPPWIIIFSKKHCQLVPKYQLVNLCHSIPYNLHVPEAMERPYNIYGSHGNFLALGTRRQRALFNPFSGKYIPLPLSDDDDCSFPRKTQIDNVKKVVIYNAALSCDPSPVNIDEGRCVLALVGLITTPDHTGSMLLYLCRPGTDLEWKVLEFPDELWSIAFYRGMLYSIDLEGWNMKLITVQDWPNLIVHEYGDYPDYASYKIDQKKTCYLVKSDGDLLLVKGNISRGQAEAYLEVFKVVEEEGEDGSTAQKTEKVEDLGEKMLFVGRRCSMSWSSAAQVSTAQQHFDQFFKKNCVYFFFHQSGDADQYDGVGRFDLKQGVCDAVLDHPFHSCAGHPRWITPVMSNYLSHAANFLE